MNFTTPLTDQALLTDAELLGRLVAFDTTSKNSNLPIADFICDYLDRPGVRIERQPSPCGDKVNLVIHVGPEVDAEARSGLILSGHMDVVPAEEPGWDSDPFELVETATTYVGRGACDMKGFDALAINLAARAASQRLHHPLVLILTYDEEVGTIGAHDFVKAWPPERPLPRRAIIGEPTSLRAVRMHKGHARCTIVLRGQSAHSGYPHLGDNAIEPAGRVIVALSELRRQLEQEICPNREHFPEVPFVALNIAQVRAGSAINIIPDFCEIDLGFRILPGMEVEPIRERIERTIAEALDGRPYEMSPIQQSPPLLLEETHDLNRSICEWVDQRETVSASYATDGGWLNRAGYDCLIFGPGSIDVAHRPNEFMPKDEFERAPAIFENLIERYCR